MDIASLQYLGPSGYTLSIEEKTALSVSMLQRSREVRTVAADVGATCVGTPAAAHT